MQTKLVIAAVLSSLAVPAIAAPSETPYALSAVHADFQAELEQTAGLPGEIGAAARAVADLMRLHSAAQERLVLPLLGRVDAVAIGRKAGGPDLPDRMRIESELSQLYEGDVALVTALVELYAVAEEMGDTETTRLAERMIWHESGDVDVLYPAALLVASTEWTQVGGMGPADPQTGAGPLHGEDPLPVPGIGNPHGPGSGN